MKQTESCERVEGGAVKAELFLQDEVPPTDADCAAFEVRVNVEELARLRQNYETERFSAICGWKNYNELKAAVEKAGYSAYNPSRMRDENEALKAKVAELEAQVADYGKTPKFTVTRKAYDELEQRANHAELEAAELRRRLGGAATDVGEERDDSVQADVNRLQKAYNKVCDNLVACHTCIDELTEKVAKAEKGRDERQKERDKERAKVKALRDQQKALEQALHDCVVFLQDVAEHHREAAYSPKLRKSVSAFLHDYEAVIDTVFPF